MDMPAPVVDALITQRDRQAQDRAKAGPRWQELDLVFSTRTGGPLGPNNLRRDFSALTHRAGLGHWALNQLRHSAGSLLSAAGVPLEQIADLF